MKIEGLYTHLGYDSFEEYAEQEHNLKRRQAYQYISVYENLGEDFVQSNAQLGITKLALLTQINTEDRAEIMEDKGFDIKDLIVWGANSGLTIGDNYDKEFEGIVQKALNEMYPDTSGLVQWAIENSIALGQLFGENFSYYAEQAFWADWNTNGVQSIQSASDEALYYAGRYGIGDKSNLKYRNPDTGEEYYAQDHPDWVEYYYNNPHPPRFFAKGGFLGSGQGIVAEAGPELIEIMNGGARITPLTGNARNTAVSGTNGAGGQKIFYSSYTINATIAGKYDVTRLAEDLEMERRRIEAGRGL